MYVPSILYNLLCRPTDAQYVNSNVYIVQYCDILRCMNIIFRESVVMYVKVTKSIKLMKSKCIFDLIAVQQDATLFSLLYFCRQFYMFRVLTPIIRSLYSCNYSFWYWLTGSTAIRSRCWVRYISVGSSTCFGCWHPSSGACIAVITASGID